MQADNPWAVLTTERPPGPEERLSIMWTRARNEGSEG